MQFVEEYEIWNRERLKYDGPFKNLREEDREQCWDLIEKKYLLRYRELIRIDFEWSSNGLWRIPYPGSICMGLNIRSSSLGLPRAVLRELYEWHNYLDSFDPLEMDKVDWDYSDREGIKVTKKISQYLPADYYLEYHRLRQVVFDGKQGIELDYDPEIKKLLHL